MEKLNKTLNNFSILYDSLFRLFFIDDEFDDERLLILFIMRYFDLFSALTSNATDIR